MTRITTRFALPCAALVGVALLTGCQGGAEPATSADAGADAGADPAARPAVAQEQPAPQPTPAPQPAAAPQVKKVDHQDRPKGAEWTPESHPAPLGAPSPDALKFPELTYDPPKATDHRFELPGGIACFVVEDHLLPMVDVTLRWKGGTANDPAGKTGAVGMLGRLLRTGGTTSLTPADVDAEIERMAASISFGFDAGSGTAHLRILKRHLGRGLDLLFDMLRNPRFADSRLTLAKDNMLEGMKGRNDDTGGIQRREVRWMLYGTDYPRARLATKAELESITVDDLRALHTALVHPARMPVLVAGDWTADEAVADLGERLSGWGPAPAEPAGVPAPDSKVQPGLYFFRKGDTTQSTVLIAKLGIKADHPDRFAIQIMNYVLGGGSFSSRLTQAIRVERGLAYSAFSGFSPGTWAEGAFVAGFQSKHATCAEGLRVALDEIERLKKDGPTQEELDGAKNASIEQFPQAFSSPEAVAGALAGLEFHNRDPKYFETMRDKIRAVTKEDCIRVAREWLDPSTFYIMMVGDIEAIQEGAATEHTTTGRTGFGTEPLGDAFKGQDIPLPDPYTLKRP